MSKEKQKRADGFEQIEEATISTEQFIEKNQKLLVRGVLVIIIVVGVILGYYRFYKAPMEEEALKQMFVAENLLKKTLSTWLLTAMGTPPVSWKSLTNTVLLLAEIWLIIMQESVICTWVTTKTPLNTWKNSLLTM